MTTLPSQQHSQQQIPKPQTGQTQQLPQSIISQNDSSIRSTAAATDEVQLTPLQKLLDKVNGQGAYQVRSFMVFNMLWFVTGWLLLGQSFFFGEEYECVNPAYSDQEACEKYICSIQDQVTRNKQISYHAKSITFAFQQFLICEFDYKVTILKSIIFIGSFSGFFFVPYLADNWGRKLAIRISWLICTMGVLIVTVAVSPPMVGVGCFLAGFGANPAITLCYSFINEQVLGKSRPRYGVLIQVVYAIGQSTIGLLFIRQLDLDWRQIFIIILSFSLIINALLWKVLIETPKFLIKKSETRALRAFNRIARINHRDPITLEQVEAIAYPIQIDIDNDSSSSSEQQNSRFSRQKSPAQSQQQALNVHSNQNLEQPILQHRARSNNPKKVIKQVEDSASFILLFKYKSLLWKALGTGAGFLGIQVIYYSTTFNLDESGYGKLINQEIVGVSEIFGYICGQIIIARVNRKTVSIWGAVITSSMCMLLALTHLFSNDQNASVMKIVQVVGLIINRFVLCCSWAVLYIYIAQLFPTKVRSLGLGFASLVGMVGSIISPYIIFLSKKIEINSWILPGAIGYLMIVFMIRLPETFGKPMIEQIEQEEAQDKLNQQIRAEQNKKGQE